MGAGGADDHDSTPVGVWAGPIEMTHVTVRRVVATLIDGFIFGVAHWLLALAFGDLRTEGEAANWVSTLAWASVVYVLFVIGYYIVLEGYLGQTVGKMATGIKVVSETTGATLAAAMVRTVLRLIDGLFCYAVAFFTALASACATAGAIRPPAPPGHPRLAATRPGSDLATGRVPARQRRLIAMKLRRSSGQATRARRRLPTPRRHPSLASALGRHR